MRLSPRLALLLAVPPLMWACNAVVGHMAIGSIGPLWLNALRWVVALVLLTPLGWQALATPHARAQVKARWRHLALLGLLGVGAYNALQYMALLTSTPLNVTLIAASSPVWPMIIGVLAYGVRPGQRQLVGAILSLAGVAVVLSRGVPSALLQIQLVQGDLLILLAILFMAIGPSIVAYRLWALAVQEAGPAIAAIFYNLTPLFAALLSAALIGEWPQPYHGLAFALIVAGITASSRSRPPAPGQARLR